MHLHLCLNGHHLAAVYVKDPIPYKIVHNMREACRCKLDHTGTAAVSGLNTAFHAYHCCHLLGCHHSLDHLCAPPQQTASGMSVATSAHTLRTLHVCYDTPYATGLWRLYMAHDAALGPVQLEKLQMAFCNFSNSIYMFMIIR